MPFEDIAPIVGRSPVAARQLASRARRRVKGKAPVPDADLARQRAVVDAFLAATQDGDFEALLALLDPDVVLRADPGAMYGGGARLVRGAEAVAAQALRFAQGARADVRPVLVNGAAGAVATRRGHTLSVVGMTVTNGRIVEIDILADPKRLRRLDLAEFD